MNNVFSDRERAFETEFACQGEKAFRLSSQAIRSLARWAAGEMGLNAEASMIYVRRAGDLAVEPDAVSRMESRLLADLKASGIDMTEGRIRLKYQRYLAQARAAAL
ncbi:DUF1476 family protein [Phaeovibrio sulfidiphilus]|uniref:DUF1476 family protein n=1 Tax=Phaeovibrio sulfidiphilus TaxID=1220600 RepID=A0A8J6YR74_9PROT|nr:ATPase inhibitor subunit zeta [Phaeovibrio sulfidiphilus]MBE1237927.1 DUF1476 family protein [Phaeovibrio sulfidiphilus]